MLVESKRLRWQGIDMCSRERRRVAVVATYALFLFAEFLHPRRTYQVDQVLFWAGMTSAIWPQIEEATSKRTRRAIAALALVVGAWVIWEPPLKMHVDTTIYTAAWLGVFSVVGWGRLVDLGYSNWMVRAMRKGAKLSWRGQRMLARNGFLCGLEGFAWNEYGMRFQELTAEQQAAVEQMQRTYPQGKWMSGMERKLVDDERLRQEDRSIRASAQRMITFLLGCSALAWSGVTAMGWKIDASIAKEWAWTLFGLAFTLRQAIVLWREEDPRAVSEDLEVVQAQEA